MRAIARLIQANGRVDRSKNLFVYKTGRDGCLRALTKEHFLKFTNKIWSPMGYPRVTGHCFRIGGTTELLLGGVPPDLVKAMGRWKSDAFQRYWRDIGGIAAKFASNLKNRQTTGGPVTQRTRASVRRKH
ncbi:hypothetical protein RhiJN_21585 [Ceratobasidium sp. AG-Ba]|nr:hypothetical protein RhiJN_21585 [Ceratobasidium sp. AG-Ba]